MSSKIMFTTFLLIAWLVGCNNNNMNEGTQPQIGENSGQVKNVSNRMNTTNVANQDTHPYNHNYDGTYSGAEDTTLTNDIRSAQQVAARASEAAEKVSGVVRAVSVVQGMDIVVGIDGNNNDMQAIEERVKQVVAKNEQGYNVYVTSDPGINERIHTLFTNMNNVKTSFVTGGIGEIIYDIGQANGHR